MNCLTCGNDTFCDNCGFCRICAANHAEKMESEFQSLRSSNANLEESIRTIGEENNELTIENARLREVLKKIRDHERATDSGGNTVFSSGVIEGHRCCSALAAKALAGESCNGQSEVPRLRDALAQYADPENWIETRITRENCKHPNDVGQTHSEWIGYGIGKDIAAKALEEKS